MGGRGTIVGPVVAALVLHLFFQGLSLPPPARVLLYALTLLVTLRFFPGGVVGTARDLASRLDGKGGARSPRRRGRNRDGEGTP